jgi:hypothetical protein
LETQNTNQEDIGGFKEEYSAFCSPSGKGKRIEYKVQKGDSLWVIANKFRAPDVS